MVCRRRRMVSVVVAVVVVAVVVRVGVVRVVRCWRDLTQNGIKIKITALRTKGSQ